MNSRFVPDAAAETKLLPQAPTAAVVTASYAPDFERCRLLCETLDRHVSGAAHHYILVEHRDVALFRQLETDRRTVVDERDLLPRWLRAFDDPLSLFRRRVWLSLKTQPLRGWHAAVVGLFAAAFPARLRCRLFPADGAAVAVADNAAAAALSAAAILSLCTAGGLSAAMYAEQIRQYERNLEPAYKVACTAAMLGRDDEAIRYLEEAMRRKEDDMMGIRIEPPFKRLRSDARYRAIVEHEGFRPAPPVGA